MALTLKFPLQLRAYSAALSSKKGSQCKQSSVRTPIVTTPTSFSSLNLQIHSHFFQPVFRTSRTCRLVINAEQASHVAAAPSEADNLRTNVIASEEKAPQEVRGRDNVQTWALILLGVWMGYYMLKKGRYAKKPVTGWSYVKKVLEECFSTDRNSLTPEMFDSIVQVTCIPARDILMAYIDEEHVTPFDSRMVQDLTQLKNASGLPDEILVSILCELAGYVADRGDMNREYNSISETQMEWDTEMRDAFGNILYLAKIWFPDEDHYTEVRQACWLSESLANIIRLDPTQVNQEVPMNYRL
ncbi:hypothetical protein MPTK1_7g18740 [Marchantia polymorpha subsp. ruderalis]|uniref:Armadillo-like repeats domain-containing protein n=2 Tax=Marchantia polymorpha TaxID=3197 RepID=A0AAF6C169_MARPO|nr:hypothetical protein MARPO_0067s0103 [Marchantia polymorpha]BBN18003.1 hypothetical protein Mp_7g18740 [Marchantia polymorpha subsp. ruderalis]|eukprot:PTQ36032.1 hypothetical protein MARPO_0067s0103 [Marchantia polymorpha]